MQPEKALPNKEDKFSEWYSAILERAELVDIRYNVKGFVVYRPNLMRIVNLIKNELEQGLFKDGHQQVMFPLVIPISYLRKEEQHITGFAAEVFKLHSEEGEEELALRPTSETAFYPMYSLWIHSYRDLPLKLFQTVTVYRKETRATRPLIRGREFYWIEAHDAFESKEKALEQVSKDIEITKDALRKLGLAFVVVEREEWDKFPGAESTFAFDCVMPDGRVLQIATTHYLGTKFSVPFDIGYLAENGSKRNVHQTCFGPGISRMAAAVIAVHGDEFGLVLPFEVAPIQIIVVPIPRETQEKQVREKAIEIGKKLENLHMRYEVDMSEERPGAKYYKWELIGAPVRIEIGGKEISEHYLTLFRRDTRKRWKIEENRLEEEIKILEKDVLSTLTNKSYEKMKNSMIRVDSKKELLKACKEEKIILMNFCKRLECSEELKEATKGYEIRGRRADVNENVWGKCAWCGGNALEVAVVAKAF